MIRTAGRSRAVASRAGRKVVLADSISRISRDSVDKKASNSTSATYSENFLEVEEGGVARIADAIFPLTSNCRSARVFSAPSAASLSPRRACAIRAAVRARRKVRRWSAAACATAKATSANPAIHSSGHSPPAGRAPAAMDAARYRRHRAKCATDKALQNAKKRYVYRCLQGPTTAR